jgi:hypothetical protein
MAARVGRSEMHVEFYPANLKGGDYLEVIEYRLDSTCLG